MATAPTPPLTPLTRKATIQTLQRIPSARRGTFLMELRDQLQQQYDGEVEVERMREVRAIHRILEKPPDARDAQDIDTLYEFVLQNGSTNKIFQGAQEIICKTICREMTLLELPAHGVVCYQGDYGDTFFIIIDGSVSLFIDSKRKLLVQNEENGIQDKSDRYLQSPGLLASKVSTMRVDSEGNPLPENYGAFIKQIGSGGTFGELAVMDPTARRSCTITCDTATSFICLKRGAYQRLIRITNSSQLDFTQVEYLETLFFFDMWPHGELTRLSNRLRHLNFPADTYLTRIGSDANVVFFIYSGIVQETVPLVHYLNANGTVYKCTRLESESSKRSIQEPSSASGAPSGAGGGGSTSSNSTAAAGGAAHRPSKDGKQQPQPQPQPQKKRIALELNVYQDHDVCGEYPVFFNKHVCNTDLLAVTDVKTLIMDRETWKELFFMHGLEHIRDAYQKFRAVAESRETWRQTRTKLALANPGLVLTISTKAMMHDGKCICGWCGSKEHITGDLACAVMAASKKKQADKQKNGKNKAKRALEMSLKAQAVKNTLTFVHTVVEAQQSERRREPLEASSQLSASALGVPRPPSTGSARRVSFQVAAKRILNDVSSKAHTSNQDDSVATTPPEALAAPVARGTGTPNASPDRTVRTPLGPSPAGSTRSLQLTSVAPLSPASTPAATATRARKDAISDFHKLSSASRKLYAHEMQQLAHPDAASSLPAFKVEDVRKSVFPERAESCYRETLVRKIKRVATLQDYFDTRSNVLACMEAIETKPSDERAEAFAQLQPRKPKIPKPLVRYGGPKGKGPRPDRFNRKINRMLKRLRLKEHPLPVVEESLKDF